MQAHSVHDHRPTALQRLRTPELIALLAASMSLTALGIDLMLPAFPDIRADFALPADSTAPSLLITFYFIGTALGQVVYGLLSDAIGRRRALFLGYGVYLLGALLSAIAPSLTLVLVSRVVWGLGAAAGRVVSVAIIRDTWSGDRMARAMSFIMAVFITVPVFAPTIGAAILLVGTWRTVFAACAVFVAAVAVWAALRLPETLAEEDRLGGDPARIVAAVRVVLGSRETLGGGLSLALLFGVITTWVGSAEIVIDDVFGRADQFPLIFGALVAAIGAGTLLNARIVERVGTRRVVTLATRAHIALATFLLLSSVLSGGRPPFLPFAIGVAGLLGMQALLAPNVNTLAMDSMGAVAGTASSVLGASQIAVGAALGALSDAAFDGTVLPMVSAFLLYGVGSAVVLRWSGMLRPQGQPVTVT